MTINLDRLYSIYDPSAWDTPESTVRKNAESTEQALSIETAPQVDPIPFCSWRKIHRFYRDWEITEKIDGTNGVVYVTAEGRVLVGSRNRWLSESRDNHGFWRWSQENAEALALLGEGYHWGEWWGQGIQRGYGMPKKAFSLFDTTPNATGVCSVVPVLHHGPFTEDILQSVCAKLRSGGSVAAPGWFSPEGVVLRHCPSGTLFKYTFDGDGNKGSQ
mgnify:FL=1